MRIPAQRRNIGRKSLAFGAVLFVLLSVDVVSVRAQSELDPRDDFNKGGRSSFQFLKIGVGARQTALGEASIALVRDANGAFWNPANITGIGSTEVSFNYNKWLADMNYVSGVVAKRWSGVGVFALSVASLDYGDIPEALVTSSGSTGDTRTGNTFGGGDMMVGLSYARDFTDRLSIGVSVKYLHESLWDYSVSNVAFDVGTNYRLGFKGLTLAMSAQNFAGSVNYLDELSDNPDGYDIPLMFRIGLSGNLVGGGNGVVDFGNAQKLVATVEAINSNDYSERFHVGGEYTFSDVLSLRGGYRFNYGEGNWAFGAGLNPTIGSAKIRVDYTYVVYKYLSAPHRLTLSIAL